MVMHVKFVQLVLAYKFIKGHTYKKMFRNYQSLSTINYL
jgi:hypothetical protein